MADGEKKSFIFGSNVRSVRAIGEHLKQGGSPEWVPPCNSTLWMRIVTMFGRVGSMDPYQYDHINWGIYASSFDEKPSYKATSSLGGSVTIRETHEPNICYLALMLIPMIIIAVVTFSLYMMKVMYCLMAVVLIVPLMVAHTIDFSFWNKNKKEDRLLHFACRFHCSATADLLLQAGANPLLPNARGETAVGTLVCGSWNEDVDHIAKACKTRVNVGDPVALGDVKKGAIYAYADDTGFAFVIAQGTVSRQGKVVVRGLEEGQTTRIVFTKLKSVTFANSSPLGQRQAANDQV
jgi:hypothetical protein